MSLTDFKVICDETNNSPETIKNNELYVHVFVPPTPKWNINPVHPDVYIHFHEIMVEQNVEQLYWSLKSDEYKSKHYRINEDKYVESASFANGTI